ncbi:MAG: hypothetical protein ACYDCH_00010 [Gaiellaceae bacterium]
MALVEQWNAIAGGLDPRWSEVRLVLVVADDERVERAAARLAPAGPLRAGSTIRFHAGRGGAGVGPEAVRRMLRRIDDDGIAGVLELAGADEAAAPSGGAKASLAGAWDAAVASLPSDWSDLLGELELTSSDHLEPAALELAPINPLHDGGEKPTFTFRAARSFGYGASAGMAHRCLERLDEAGIPGTLRIVRVQCDTDAVGTQGPVWIIGGKAV